ncbi:MAG TPA: NAD(P)-binding oxidoreductase [Devosia sp.]|nr:NAD(P)-binding oxidoreductase [Devosia sp.]
MRVVVIGGHGRTGMLVVKQLIAKGDAVVATIRNPKHMTDMVKLGAQTVLLDLDKSPLSDFAVALKGADAVVFAAGSAEGESSALDRKGTVRSVKAAEKAGVKRFVTISALGDSTPVPDKWNTPEMKDYYKQKRAGSKAIRASSLKWTILEPGELTEGRGTGKIGIATDGVDVGKIARADVAATVVAVLGNAKTVGKTFQIVGGKTAIDEAVAKAMRK